MFITTPSKKEVKLSESAFKQLLADIKPIQRSEFDKMNPTQQALYIRAKGRVKD